MTPRNAYKFSKEMWQDECFSFPGKCFLLLMWPLLFVVAVCFFNDKEYHGKT